MRAKELISIFILFAAIAAVFSFGTEKILDPDSFYHIRHAWLYRTEGLFNSVFPWVQFSVIKDFASDIWYGFHILLIPFTLFPDLIFGVRLSAVLFSAASLLFIYIGLKKMRVWIPLFWSLLLYFSAPDFLFRINMSRPQTLTIGLTALLFALFLKNPSFWPVFALSVVIAWIHLSLFWVVIAVTSAAATGVLIFQKRFEWKKLLATFLGLATGWLLRPNPFGTLKILKVQLFDLFAVKQQGLPLLFGEELSPLDSITIKLQLIPILLIIIATLAVFVWVIAKKRFQNVTLEWKTAFWPSIGLSLGFFIIAFIAGRRAMDFWLLFSIFFIGQLITLIMVQLGSPQAEKIRRGIVVGLAAIFLFMTARHSYIFYLFTTSPTTILPDKFQKPMLWLKENGQPGEIVFHTGWDDFPMLFFWNQKNYYINGMDPIFQYAKNPSLYWESHFLAIGGQPFTCNAIPCTLKAVRPLYEAIAEDFNTAYVIIDLERNFGLNGHLAKHPKFEKVFENDSEILYRVN